MRVLWFTNTPAGGIDYLNLALKGTGGWLYSLDNYMQNVVELNIAFLYPYKKPAFRYNKTMYYPVFTGNIIVENLKNKWLNQTYNTNFLLQYIEVIERVKPDIIHIHGTENSFGCIIDKVNVPIVVSMQGILTVIHHKFLSGLYGEFLKFKKLEFSLKNFLFGKTNFYDSYCILGKMAVNEKRYLRKTKNIIGRTEWDRRVTRILAPDSKYFVVNEMLRDSFYNSCQIKKELSNKIVIHTTSGNSYFKGFETLCNAINLLNDMGLNFEWRVAGISSNSLINIILKKKLKGNYPKKSLKLLGSLAESQLVDKMNEAHIYVMTSHIENSPNNLCEAMILGLPCIASNVGGTNTLLKDGEDGILIQDGDPWVLSGAILELIENWDVALILGENARKRALERHDRLTIRNSILDVYHLIISSHQQKN